MVSSFQTVVLFNILLLDNLIFSFFANHKYKSYQNQRNKSTWQLVLLALTSALLLLMKLDQVST